MEERNYKEECRLWKDKYSHEAELAVSLAAKHNILMIENEELKNDIKVLQENMKKTNEEPSAE